MSVKIYQELESIKPLWRALFDESGGTGAFQLWEWVACWWEFYGKSNHQTQAHNLAIFVIYAETGKVVGIFPFYNQQTRAQDRRVVYGLFGDFGRNGMAEEPIYLVHRDYKSYALDTLVEFLQKPHRSIQWDLTTLHFKGTELTLKKPLRWPFGRLINSQEGPGIVYVPKTWDSYLRTLSKSMRGNLRYYPKLLEKDGYTFEVEVVAEPAKIIALVEELILLHRDRSESPYGPKHSDHISNEQDSSFLKECLYRLAMSGHTVIGVLRINDEIAAIQSMLVANGEVLFYYSGFSHKFHKYSPLTILIGELIKGWTERGIDRLNFLGPSAAHFRTRWGTQIGETIYIIHIVTPRISAYSRLLADRVATRK